MSSKVSHATAPFESALEPVFLADMQDFFGGWRGGHIARHGYVGNGGEIYSQWLKKNAPYRSHVTLAETELIAAYVEDLSNVCGKPERFVEVGAGGFTAFQMKTHALLSSLAAKNRSLKYTIVDVSGAAFQSIANHVEALGMPAPDYFNGNFFSELPNLKVQSTIYMSGLTFTNVPENALRGDTQEILTQTISFFGRALSKNGGTFVFSYATADGIGNDGAEIKQFYDDPLIHDYQKSIFKRVESELHPAGTFSADAFQIHHVWHAGKAVLTRHATIMEPMCFTLGDLTFDLKPETFNGYMANNFRPSDAMISRAADQAKASNCRIFSCPTSNVRLAAVSFGLH